MDEAYEAVHTCWLKFLVNEWRLRASSAFDPAAGRRSLLEAASDLQQVINATARQVVEAPEALVPAEEPSAEDFSRAFGG